jgi:hypothetical protein
VQQHLLLPLLQLVKWLQQTHAVPLLAELLLLLLMVSCQGCSQCHCVRFCAISVLLRFVLGQAMLSINSFLACTSLCCLKQKAVTTTLVPYPVCVLPVVAAAAGMITSMDDFYILSGSHLVVTETSNDILDPAVWQQVVPQAALSWERVLVANWLSSSGKEWAHWMKQYNSGV